MSEGARTAVATLRHRNEAGDWVAQAVVAIAADQALFIPGSLPCGECGPCRRALISGCVAQRDWLADQSLGPNLELPGDLPERFTYAFDPNQLAPRLAVWADLVAPLLEAMGRSGLGPGDISYWIGTSPQTVLAAILAAGRGSKALLVGPDHLNAALTSLAEGDDASARFVGWNNLDKEAVAMAEASPGGFLERQVFVLGDDALAWSAAVHLLAPGTTLVGFGGLPAIAGLPPDARVFTLGAKYNPDFVPEALAALAQNPTLLRACAHLEQSGVYSVWPDSA